MKGVGQMDGGQSTGVGGEGAGRLPPAFPNPPPLPERQPGSTTRASSDWAVRRRRTAPIAVAFFVREMDFGLFA
eukprot:3435976-Pyramimonas_sp.AAC.1